MTGNGLRGLGIIDLIDRSLATGADVRISFDDREWTLAELDRWSRQLAIQLRQDIGTGERVGIMARNCPFQLVLWWACARRGNVVVPWNIANVGRFLAHQVEDSQPTLLFAQEEFREELTRAAESAGVPAPQAVPEEPAESPEPPGSMGATGPMGVTGPDPAAPGHLVFTSGTTGVSKACVVSHRYLVNFAIDVAENLERMPEETVWTALPLFHLSALTQVAATVALGSRISLASRFSVRDFWPAIERSGARVAATMGAMLALVAQAPDSPAEQRCHGQLRAVSGSPVSRELAQLWRDRFGVRRAGAGVFGMTEAALITMTPPGAYRAGTAGQAIGSFEVELRDESDRPVPNGTVGEITCRPRRPGVMFDGYWNRPEQTEEAWRGGWFHTGDLGRFDDEGYLSFVDRVTDSLRRGGENISSYELETAIAAHPRIAEVAVHAVPSALGEDEVKVVVVPQPGTPLDPVALHDWICGQVPRYARPRYLELREQLPRNPVGRVLKHLLRAEGITPATLDFG
ncbi:ATP-dependent acyl-CoA ligase [Enemella dayhoffiae]|uniref:ATP-dependent acyl-CoA ligase n=1 Tax=Enemella dayhoffiae TaxID=2016507 RepID=A0A255GPT2_9ACTN|nr:AMP-binding protein [Enemella dayhoffiae]OYO16576.1 ATP-dependent acyl-CoA ligase [Enemella dayhoffiae]